MRPLWKGAISFGLVNIPVRLYAATERKDPQFHYLHQVCGSPVKYLKWCPYCDREVRSEEIVWGYEYEKGKYLVFREDELEGIPSPAPRTITIEDFVDIREIDPVYFDKTYFLEPAEGGERAYALLRGAMRDSGRIAVARVAIRSKESLATVRQYGDGILVMETMFWPDEIRSAAALSVPAGDEMGEREAQMARTLVEMLSGAFDPAKYRSERRERLGEMIEAKMEGRGVEAPRPPEAAKVVDLMEALKRSIAGAEEKRARDGGTQVPASERAH
ncbi:MAG: Ku protein [Ignavibacteriales bacterium]